MRTKICLPNSPKKSLKHFVILKCLENELEPWRGCSYGMSPSVKPPHSLTQWQLGWCAPPCPSISGEWSWEIRHVESASASEWPFGEKGKRAWEPSRKLHTNLGSSHGPWLALRSGLMSVLTDLFPKRWGSHREPSKWCSFPSGGSNPLLTPKCSPGFETTGYLSNDLVTSVTRMRALWGLGPCLHWRAHGYVPCI